MNVARYHSRREPARVAAENGYSDVQAESSAIARRKASMV